MYVPAFNALDGDSELRALVRASGTAELVTVGPDGYPVSTLLPVVWEEDRLLFHLARANPHWRLIGDGQPALAVVTGPQAYVSPAWYPSKQDHGRVVPTWNYSAVQFRGRVTLKPDADWLADAVARLTGQYEQDRPEPWHVTDAPEPYIAGQLKAIVGVEFAVEKVEGKAKLSQNRSEADHAGVVDGLLREGGGREAEVAAAMQRTGTRPTGR